MMAKRADNILSHDAEAHSMMVIPAENILPHDGEVYYYENFLSEELSNQYFDDLRSLVKWKQEPIKLFGKEIMQPRLTAWYGDSEKSYTYSNLTMQANIWIEPLIQIKLMADEYSGSQSTSALLNLYRDGKDGMGWHRDNEKMLGNSPVIASVTLGQERIFQLRNYFNKKEIISVTLSHGSLLVMKGASQKNWEHRIPKTTKTLRPRINITFRRIM